ncbi:MAG: 3-deoxy-manno-octulosonate cytidylyltransferase [Steroidobacteraceae bacterium]
MFRVVIPARYAAARLPGKPLLPLAGKPLVQWVHERASAAGAQQVLIATDDDLIVSAAHSFGAEVVMTAATHASGTDRIAEVARAHGWAPAGVVVNVQGDEPLMPTALIRQVAALLEAHADADMATLASPITAVSEFLDPNTVKVVADGAGRALYFSRAPIPWNRDGAPAGLASQRDLKGARRHVGIYAYRVAALLRLAELPVSALEASEKLEQLRALENGFDIRVGDAAERPGPDVNTLADLERLRAQIARAPA